MATFPSGEQHELRLGEQQATIVEVGGGIREYRHGDRDVLHPYPHDAMCDGAHGCPLVPWPNRLADGRYRFDGVDYQVELSEPEKHNAIHGFLRWSSWRASEKSDSHVVMTCRLNARKGYPWSLDIDVRYELTPYGLVVTTVATNIGAGTAPFGLGQHPYLSPGTGPSGGLIDDCTLQFTATTRIDTDPERQLPIGRVPVAGTPYDFSVGRRIDAFAMDYAFTDLQRDDTGRARLALTGVDGRTVELWAGPDYPVLEVFTADTLSPERRRHGLGVEPMTCPPNALASSEDVIRIDAGETVTRTWGVALVLD